MSILIGVLVVIAALWLFTHFVLQGPDHSAYDRPGYELMGERAEPSPEHHAVVKMLEAGGESLAKVKGSQRLALMRSQMDQMGASVVVDGRVQPVDAGGVPAEWVVARNADPSRRLLYIHGGALITGSPRSHRAITAELSARARAAVLAIDYRLMPEHPRRASIEDCQTGYRFILDHGPEGPAALQALMVAGDSAGGNLALMTIAWARDARLRAADAVVALSPATDTTLGSPSLKSNRATDPMIGPAFSQLATVPRPLMLWFSLLSNRINPSNPVVSPLLGDLSGLPPTLVHVSDAEMIRDDGVRYVNKAKAAGSPAVLGVWPHMLHVWHAFVRHLPEAKEAFDHIEAFLDQYSYPDRSASQADAAAATTANGDLGMTDPD